MAVQDVFKEEIILYMYLHRNVWEWPFSLKRMYYVVIFKKDYCLKSITTQYSYIFFTSF